ncbi:MAG: hemerythrin family protein [Treponema sp.]|jgi:hemerythrin|nr:hemerythrin family protein [Treponema sp.]
MVAYRWDSTLETGHEIIDTQHKQLFEAINNLLDTCHGEKGSEELTKKLDFLNTYTIKHFFDEERIQQKYHYPDYPKHKQYHETFKNTVKDLTHRLIWSGPSEELIKEVYSSIGDWLVSHIKIQDFKLAKYIRAQHTAS